MRYLLFRLETVPPAKQLVSLSWAPADRSETSSATVSGTGAVKTNVSDRLVSPMISRLSETGTVQEKLELAFSDRAPESGIWT